MAKKQTAAEFKVNSESGIILIEESFLGADSSAPDSKPSAPPTGGIEPPIVVQDEPATVEVLGKLPGLDQVRLLAIPIAQLVPSPTNPRKRFNDVDLDELGESLRNLQLQPILVRPMSAGDVPPEIFSADFDEYFEIVSGHRRYFAAKRNGIKSLLATVCELSDIAVIEAQVVENNQRVDVHPLEEAEGFKALLARPEYKDRNDPVRHLAEKIGKSRSYIYDRLKLCELTEDAKVAFAEGQMTAGHAIQIARRPEEQQKELIEKVAGKDVSVRDLAHEIRRKSVSLDFAPFDRTVVGLIKDVPSCLDCPKRGIIDLEGTEHPDICTDENCFKAKCSKHIKDRTAEAFKELRPKAVTKLATSYSYEKDVLSWDSWRKANADSPEAEVGVIAEASKYTIDKTWIEMGTIVHFTRPKVQRFQKSDSEKERDREHRLQGKYRASLTSEIIGVPCHDFPLWGEEAMRAVLYAFFRRLESVDQVTICKAFGWEPRASKDWQGNQVAIFDEGCFKAAAAEMRLQELYKVARLMAEHRNLKHGIYGGDSQPTGLEALAHSVGINHAAIRAGVYEDKPAKPAKAKKLEPEVQTTGLTDQDPRIVTLEAKRLERDQLDQQYRDTEQPSKKATELSQQVEKLKKEIEDLEAQIQ